MKKMMILLLFSTSIVHAELKTLDSQALREVEGQAGADLSLKFSLNLNWLDKYFISNSANKDLRNFLELRSWKAIILNAKFDL